MLVLFPPVEQERLIAIREHAGSLPIINAADVQEAELAIAQATAFFGKLTPHLLARSTKLEWVQSPTASLEHYIFPELMTHPCTLTNMRGLFSDVVADHVMGLVLCFARNLHRYIRQQAVKKWEPIGGMEEQVEYVTGPHRISAVDRSHQHLADQRMCVFGVGAIGEEICKRATAFGMTVTGVDPHSRTLESGVVVSPLESLDEQMGLADYMVIAAPHTPQTAGLFNAARLAKLNPHAVLINIGRGAIVQLDALTEALQMGAIRGAGLDVFETEPLPTDHPLWDFENVILTPHVAAASPRIAERHLATLLENIRRFVSGQPLLNVVNKKIWC